LFSTIRVQGIDILALLLENWHCFAYVGSRLWPKGSGNGGMMEDWNGAVHQPSAGRGLCES